MQGSSPGRYIATLNLTKTFVYNCCVVVYHFIGVVAVVMMQVRGSGAAVQSRAERQEEEGVCHD